MAQNKIEEFLSKPIVIQVARFLAIGFLNTALDFLILDILATITQTKSGIMLGYFNVPGFCLAVIQGYYFNKYWTFRDAKAKTITIWNEFGHICFGVILGVITLGGLFAFARYESPIWAYYALGCLFLAGLTLLIHWVHGLSSGKAVKSQLSGGNQIVLYVVVSVLGLLINTGLVIWLSDILYIPLVTAFGTGIPKLLAKVLATGVTMVFNFVGYKMIVFKK